MAGAADTSALAIAAGASRLRQRKISVKQRLRILWERDLPDFVEDVRSDLLGITETGVDKSEEDERHLQAVLSASTVAPAQGKPGRDAYIPTPSASKKWAEYSHFYQPGWVESTSYIHSSATVEDALGCEYNMDEEDAAFLEELNKGVTDTKQKCSEDELEMLCALFESVIAEKQPFLATDVSQIMPYSELEPHIVANLEARRRNAKNPMDPEQLLYEAHSEDYAPRLAPSPYRTPLASVRTFGNKVYEHWRERKVKAQGHSVFPSLKFETGLASDDSDPYVCFRRRELRHTRKTRRTDAQNSGRLRKLHAEMQSARSLVELVLRRERTRLQQIQTDFEIFEARCRVKALKRKIGGGDDPELAQLLVSVPKRVRKEEAAKTRREERERERREKLAQEKAERAQQQAASASASASAASSASTTAAKPKPATPAVAGSRIPDLEHVTLTEYRAELSNLLQQRIAEKLRERQLSDLGWVNLTEEALVPFADFFAPYAPDGLGSDSAFSSLEYDMSAALDNMRRTTPRMALPLAVDVPVNATPEIVTTDGEGRLARYGEVDFAREPDRFSVPRHGPQVSLRRQVADGMQLVDRKLPEAPLGEFGRSLATAPQSEADERLADRFRFDHNDADYGDVGHDDEALRRLFLDPARLNELDPMKHALRFGAMVTKKVTDALHEAHQQHRRVTQAAAKRQAQQTQAQQRAMMQQHAQQAAQQRAQQNAQVQLRVQHAQKIARKQALRQQGGSNGVASAPGGQTSPPASGSPTASSALPLPGAAAGVNGKPASQTHSNGPSQSPSQASSRSQSQSSAQVGPGSGTPSGSPAGASQHAGGGKQQSGKQQSGKQQSGKQQSGKQQSGKQSAKPIDKPPTSGKQSSAMNGRHSVQGQKNMTPQPQPPKIEAGG